METCCLPTLIGPCPDPSLPSTLHRTLFYPKAGKNEFYQKLRKQCLNLSIPEIGASDEENNSGSGSSASPQEAFKHALANHDIVMDAIFGFSFKGEPRSPFDEVITALKETDKPIISVDIPSAWDVEKGNINNRSFTPGKRCLHAHFEATRWAHL